MRGAALLVVSFCAFGVAAQESDPQQVFQEGAQAQQRGDFALAASKYQEVIRLDPNVVAAHANLGVVLVSLGRYDEAVTQYHIALAEAPGDPALRLNLGLGYYKKGDFAGAAAEFASLHKENPADLRVAKRAHPDGHNSPQDWAESVKNSVRVTSFTATLDNPGYHTLKVWMVDPGVVLQKLIVDLGGVRESYLGPPKSYCRPKEIKRPTN